MKNLATILAFVFAFTFTTQAQKKRKEKKPNFTIEQRVNLAIKKMTLALDLSDKQQKQLKPIFIAQATQRKAAMEKRREARKNKKRPTAEEIYAMKDKQLDNRIMMKNKMKDILNKEQFEKFKKMQKKRKLMAMKKMKKKKQMMAKKRKMKKQKKDRK
ncbi:hypothetical protein [Polaribacter aquimarinus]|uniref:DUF4890 domain-containing protein n=1 Tax=Polaribacter aquimarinus TaxID=2100726 RepID=A0A2U2J8K0_9FLAO|nr:hypothetical protein [Polaribacter aquimarinus]PWG04673.1 hypothetical protein DIS07_12065 [Polaribacter aquimarinus]